MKGEGLGDKPCIAPVKGSAVIGDFWFFSALAFALVLAGLVQFLLYSSGFYGISADDSGRSIVAYKWSSNMKMSATTWLPFDRVVVGLLLRFWPDLFIVPRVVVSVFGIFTVVSLTWLSHELFKNRAISVFTAFLSAVFAPRVILSVVPLAEIMFISMVVTALAFFVRWLSSMRSLDLFFTSFFFTVGSSIRYEGWVFSLCFVLYLIGTYFRKEGGCGISAWTVFFSAAIVGLFPIYWMSIYFADTGNPVGFFFAYRDPLSEFHQRFAVTSSKLLRAFALRQFLTLNCESFNLVGIFSLAALAKDHGLIRRWAVVPFASLAVFSGFGLLGYGTIVTHSLWAPVAVWAVLLVPFSAHFIFRQWEDLLGGGRLGGVAVLASMMVLFLAQMDVMTLRPDFTAYDRAVGEYLRVLLVKSPSARVLVESRDWGFIHVEVASRHPYSFVPNSGTPYLEKPGEDILLKGDRIEGSGLIERNITFLAFKGVNYQRLLDSDPRFDRLERFGAWSVYRFNSAG